MRFQITRELSFLPRRGCLLERFKISGLDTKSIIGRSMDNGGREGEMLLAKLENRHDRLIQVSRAFYRFDKRWWKRAAKDVSRDRTVSKFKTPLLYQNRHGRANMRMSSKTAANSFEMKYAACRKVREDTSKRRNFIKIRGPLCKAT